MLRLLARGKINWTLDVLRKREDGYHDLDMLLQSVTLADTLMMERAAELTLSLGRGIRVRTDGDNLILKAARALQGYAGTSQGAAIVIEKRVPIGAGMGGGSADAAAILVGLNRLWGLNLGDEALAEIGLTLGADVPFCIRGGLQRACGVGERLQTLSNPPLPLWLVAVQPCRGLSTRDVFGALCADNIDPMVRPDNDAAVDALRTGDVSALCRAMGNVLEPIASALRPEIPACIAYLVEQGALYAQMTGSGSAVYGVFPGARTAHEAFDHIRTRYRFAYLMATAAVGLQMTEG